MQKIKNLILPVVFSLGLLFSLTPSVVLAQQTPKQAITEGVCDASGQTPCTSQAATNSLNSTLEGAINLISLLVGIVAVIMLIVAGFRYVTAAGNEQSVEGAKKTFTYAIIGLFLVVL